jgi:gamma-glutamylcyclotransferase (GGCT)/AIG2-like uncharacterized protein YtfP
MGVVDLMTAEFVYGLRPSYLRKLISEGLIKGKIKTVNGVETGELDELSLKEYKERAVLNHRRMVDAIKEREDKEYEVRCVERRKKLISNQLTTPPKKSKKVVSSVFRRAEGAT